MNRHNNAKIGNLWNGGQCYLSNKRHYSLLIEQYKIYVENSDHRLFYRASTNLFFLITNIVIVSVMVLGISHSNTELSLGLLVLLLIAILTVSYCCWTIEHFYHHTVNIKEQVINALEKYLLFSPIFSAEQVIALQKVSFTAFKHIETYMPFVSFLLYTYIYLLIAWGKINHDCRFV